VRLAADANVLLSAVLGGRARLILASPAVEAVFTTATVLDEVREYAPIVAAKKKLSAESILLAVSVLPVEVIAPDTYRRKLAEARRRIGDRDPDDADLLALCPSGLTTATLRWLGSSGSLLRSC
jgi:predicted nucleic acid-binding protein